MLCYNLSDMKKLRYIVLSFCILTACMLSGCFGCNINNRANTAYYTPDDDGEYFVYNIKPYTYSDYALKIDKTTGEAVLEESGSDSLKENYYLAVAWGNDFPLYSSECAEGYESLFDLLKEKYENGRVKQIQYYAVEYDEENKVAYGFCNLYSSTAGFFAGGGNIDAGKIVGAAYFAYECNSNSINEICYLEKCNVVAFNTEKLIYFRGEKYYAYDCATLTETFICKDEAYDKGITNYSHVTFLFNGDICLILMKRGYSNNKKEYEKIIVCDYGGKIILEDSWNSWDYLTRNDN